MAYSRTLHVECAWALTNMRNVHNVHGHLTLITIHNVRTMNAFMCMRTMNAFMCMRTDQDTHN